MARICDKYYFDNKERQVIRAALVMRASCIRVLVKTNSEEGGGK